MSLVKLNADVWQHLQIQLLHVCFTTLSFMYKVKNEYSLCTMSGNCVNLD